MRVPSSRASATAARWRERFSRSPKRSARRSTTIAPALWRELAYRSSGLPSPRISQGPVSRRDAPASSPPVAGSAAFVPDRRARRRLEVADPQNVADLQAGHVAVDRLGHGGDLGLDTELVQVLVEDAALDHARRLADQVDRHRHGHLLAAADDQEVDMGEGAADRVPLDLARQREVADLAELELEQGVGATAAHRLAERAGIDRQVLRLDAVAVQDR